MVNLSKVQKQIFEKTPTLGRENVPILDSLGRILVHDITAVEDLPVSDISAMDGYAVRHVSLNGASLKHPTSFKIVGESPAGKPYHSVVGNGEAVRIMTGGLVPKRSDTVIKQENTIEENGYVFCQNNPGYGGGIRFQGESLKKREVVLHAGDVIGPMEIGALAILRRAYVYVHRKPIVAILSTGDELSDFHEPSSPSKAMCSNIYTLAAQVIETGAEPLCLGIVKDDLSEVKNLLCEALRADVIITSGGSSKGKYDLINKAFTSMGMDVRFSNIFEKPGKPTVFGKIKESMVFGLPGNPTATMLSFDQFIKPALLKMMGHQNMSSVPQFLKSPFNSLHNSLRCKGKHHRAPQIPLKKNYMNSKKFLNKSDMTI